MGAGDFDEAEMPFDPTRPEDLAQGGNFRLESSLGILGVMQWVPGTDADHAYAVLGADAVDAEADGVRVRICSLAHLYAMKCAAGRPQDCRTSPTSPSPNGDGDERPR